MYRLLSVFDWFGGGGGQFGVTPCTLHFAVFTILLLTQFSSDLN